MLLNAFLFFLLNIITPATSNRVNYSIIEKSSLSLSGSSNVNRFQCSTYDNFSDGFILIHTDEEEETVKFNNAVLKINIKSFDCRNPLLTKDFYNALNVKENPTIDVELLSAEPMGRTKILKANKGRFKADVAISLNGTSKLDQIIVHWEQTGYNTYRFIGDKKLLMSDFDIDSPVTALGLIKVNDEINISFDLFVQANPKIF